MIAAQHACRPWIACNVTSRLLWLGVAAVKELEDPLKMLDQAVVDMQTDLVKMRQAAAQVLTNM